MAISGIVSYWEIKNTASRKAEETAHETALLVAAKAVTDCLQKKLPEIVANYGRIGEEQLAESKAECIVNAQESKDDGSS